MRQRPDFWAGLEGLPVEPSVAIADSAREPANAPRVAPTAAPSGPAIEPMSAPAAPPARVALLGLGSAPAWVEAFLVEVAPRPGRELVGVLDCPRFEGVGFADDLDLEEADLEEADLEEADLDGADLEAEDLEAADLEDPARAFFADLEFDAPVARPPGAAGFIDVFLALFLLAEEAVVDAFLEVALAAGRLVADFFAEPLEFAED